MFGSKREFGLHRLRRPTLQHSSLQPIPDADVVRTFTQIIQFLRIRFQIEQLRAQGIV